MSGLSDAASGRYRPDIDGIRAIAVVAVVFFHAAVPGIPGGYLGVDVFFAISGYLISGIILRGLEQNNFSLGDFYVRRINRIFPALIAVLCGTFLLGWLLMYAMEFPLLGEHVIGGSTFSSNFILRNAGGYFDVHDKPLLHLWSLAVEEQFYLMWPATLLILWKTKRDIRLSLIVIIATSLVANVWFVRQGRTTDAFYLPWTRLWEILAGSLLVQIESSPDAFADWWRRVSGRHRELLSLSGALLLAFSFVRVFPGDQWFGLKNLCPIAGTLFLISAGSHAWINRKILSAPFIVMIGLISYPLYLWHWPLLVFARLVNGYQPRLLARAMMVGAALVLADATYRFIEQPIRFGKHKRRSAMRLLPALVGTAALGIIAYRGTIGTRLEDSEEHMIARWGPDWVGPGSRVFDTLDFHFRGTMAADTATVVLYGDSHIQQYWPRVMGLGLDSVQKSPRIVLLARGGCPPLPGVEEMGVDWDGIPWNCNERNRVAFAYMMRPRVKTVVIGAFWESYVKNKITYLVTAPSSRTLTEKDPNAIKAYDLLGDQIASLVKAGKTVYVILSNPTRQGRLAGSGLPLRLGGFGIGPAVPSVPRQQFVTSVSWTTAQLRRIAERSGARIIDPVPFLCGPSTCPLVGAGDEPIFRDGDHLRASFVARHVSFLDEILTR
jgi:peptidoglycan/LPS O-acetylase OafA/YrhL